MFELKETQMRLLAAIHQAAGTAPGGGASMWSIGESLGLDRDKVQDLAMDLNAEGFLEIKSLSGKVALTPAGLELLQAQDSPAAEPENQDALLNFTVQVEAELNNLGIEETAMKDLRLDLETLRLQAARSKKLIPVIKSALVAVKEALAAAPKPPGQALVQTLENLLNALD